MRVIVVCFFLSGCSVQLQLGVPTEQKIESQLAPLVRKLNEHAQVINNQAKAIEELYSSEEVNQPKQKEK